MKVCVGTRPLTSGKEPSRLCLGRCSLPVAAVLDCHDEDGARLFTVRVLDGRRFALRLRGDSNEWDLVAAYGRAARQAAPNRQPTPPAIALLAATRWRKLLQLCKRVGRWAAGDHASAVPGGGAPA